MSGSHLLHQARLNVADTFHQSYHKAAILSGSWDAGQIVQAEVARLEAERLRAKPEEVDE